MSNRVCILMLSLVHGAERNAGKKRTMGESSLATSQCCTIEWSTPTFDPLETYTDGTFGSTTLTRPLLFGITLFETRDHVLIDVTCCALPLQPTQHYTFHRFLQ